MQLIISITFGVLGGFLAYVTAIMQGPHNDVGVALLALSLCITITMMVYGTLLRSGTAMMILNAYMTVFYIFPGILHASTNSYPFYGLTYNAEDVTSGAAMVLLFAVSSAMGSLAFVSRQPPYPYGRLAPSPPQFVKSWFIAALCILSLLLIARLGIGNFLQRRSDSLTTDVSSEVGLILFSLARTLPVVALAAILHRLRFQGWTIANTVGLLGTLAVNSIANFPLAIPRFTLFGVIITLLPLVFNVATKRFKSVFLAGLVFGVGTIFPLASFLQRGEEGSEFAFDFLGYFQSSGDLDGFQSTINVSMLVDNTGLSWGWQLVSGLLFFVPRSIWPSKGFPTGLLAADNAGYLFLNISSPLPSEAYVDFGYAGCVIFGLAVGYFVAKIDFLYVNASGRYSLRHYLLLGGISAYEIILMRGPLLGVSGPIALYFGISLVTTSSWWLQRRVRGQNHMESSQRNALPRPRQHVRTSS